MTRKYSGWLKLLKESEATYVLRHDVDYDIHMARKLMEIERRLGLSSIVYVLPNSPSYSISDIKKLYDDFKDDGFLFGMHIGNSYDNSDPEGAFNDYLSDLKTFEENDIKVHSCVAHFWQSSIIPPSEYSNKYIEERSDKENICPSFYALYKGYIRLGDSSGSLSPDSWVSGLQDDKKYFMQTHPVYYRVEGDDAIFTKSVKPDNVKIDRKELREPSHKRIRAAQDSIKGHKGSTVYFVSDPMTKPHLTAALNCVDQIVKSQHKELIRVVDVGGGIGILGAYLNKYNNLKYTCIDIEQKFIEAGREFFNSMHLSPNLICADLYKNCPEGDVLILLAYEDCWTDYKQLYDVCKNFKQVIVTITGDDMIAEAKTRNKKYWHIPFTEFEHLFCTEGNFNIKFKDYFKNKRHFYWLTKTKNLGE
jgi:hypothetical protein